MVLVYDTIYEKQYLEKGKKERDVNCTLNSSFHSIQIPADFSFTFICNEDSKQKAYLYYPNPFKRTHLFSRFLSTTIYDQNFYTFAIHRKQIISDLAI